MKRFLSILLALVVPQFTSIAGQQIIYYANVDQSGQTQYQKCGLYDWDSTLCKDLGKAGKKWEAFWIGGIRMANAAKGRKKARVNGQPLEGLVSHLDYMIEREPKLARKRNKLMWKLNKAEPLVKMIEQCQQLQAQGMKLIIATNNDYGTLAVKTRKLNANLRKKQLKPLQYDGVYCAGSCPEIKNGKAPNGMPAGCVYAGKFSDEYFEKLFRFAETEFGYNRKNTLFIFVDDLKINIDRALKVAQREGVALIAVHKNTSDKKVVDALQAALSSLEMHTALAPVFANPPYGGHGLRLAGADTAT